MALGVKVDLSPGDFVLDGDPASLPNKVAESPIFGPCLLWPNGKTDQDGTWHGGGPVSIWHGGKSRPRRRCVRWGRSSRLKGGTAAVFGSCLLCPNGWMDEDATWYESRPRPRPHTGSRLPAKGAQQPRPSFRPMSIVATVAHLSYC